MITGGWGRRWSISLTNANSPSTSTHFLPPLSFPTFFAQNEAINQAENQREKNSILVLTAFEGWGMLGVVVVVVWVGGCVYGCGCMCGCGGGRVHVWLCVCVCVCVNRLAASKALTLKGGGVINAR